MILILLVGSLLLNVILALMLDRRSKDVDRLADSCYEMSRTICGLYFACRQCGRIVPVADNPMDECLSCYMERKHLEPLHHQGRVEMPGLTHANTASPPE